MKEILAASFSIISFVAFSQGYVNSPYEKGHLKDGSRVGIWEFYSEDKELELKIDLSDGKIYYLQPSESEYVVQLGNEWRKVRPDVYPAYALGSRNFYNELRKFLKFPLEEVRSGRASLMFTVDSLGKAGNFEIIEHFGFDSEVLDAIREIPNVWLPAIQKGKKLNSRFILPIVFLSPRSKITDKVYEQEATVLRPLIITNLPEPVDPVTTSLRFKGSRGYKHKELADAIEEYEVHPKSNIKNGIYQRYTGFGNVIRMLETGMYKNDQKTGLWREYMTTEKWADVMAVRNKIKQSGHYENGLKQGIWEEYQLNWKPELNFPSSNSFFYNWSARRISRLSAKGRYVDGKKSGRWLNFDRHGDTLQIYDYSKHLLICDKEFVDAGSFNKSQSPLYEGGSEKLSIDFYEYFDFSNVRDVIREDSTYAIFLVTVDSSGKTAETKYLQGTTHHLVTAQIAITWKRCDRWIPAHKDGQAVSGSNVYAVSITRKEGIVKNLPVYTYAIQARLVNH